MGEEAINPAGLALKAMQSDNIFTVGGSLAANAHGRDIRFPMLVQSVLSFRVLLADGSVRLASRNENPGLFRNAIGGYGLFGVILDVDLELVENCLNHSLAVIPLNALVGYLEREVLKDPRIELFLARPSISPHCLLDDTIVSVWRRTDEVVEGAPPLDHERHVARDRFLFGLSRHYEWGKALRWHVRNSWPETARERYLCQDNAMRPPVSSVRMLEHNSSKDADVIPEFFIPIPRFMGFMDGMRKLLQAEDANLLGVTLRYVKANDETTLSYVQKEDSFAVILYFNEARSTQGRAKGDRLINRMTGWRWIARHFLFELFTGPHNGGVKTGVPWNRRVFR